ncbi:MAG TPA: response regulator [Clostridia bacterium]|nr:response regulator [Clostridia bacterium]
MQHDDTILVIANNPDDVLFVTSVLKRLGKTSPLQVLSDGFAAVQYLKGEGPFRRRKQFRMPQLMLLDLDLPLSSGFEFLEWLRQEPELRHLPVVAFSGSVLSEDLDRADELGANYLLFKDSDLEDYTATLKQVLDFWLNPCQAPDSVSSPDWLVSTAKPGLRPNIGWVPRSRP